MPIAPAAYQWSLAFGGALGTLALDVPGAVAWSTAPLGRVATNPCTGARTLITRGDGAVPPPDVPATIRVDPPAATQATIRNALKTAWATGATGTLTPPLTSLLPARTVALDPSQAFAERQEGGVLFVSVLLLGMS